MADLVQVLSDMVGNIINAIPAILAAIIVILIGYFIGMIVGKAINKVFTKLGIEKAFDGTAAGRAFRSAGIDMSDFICGVVKAFILVMSSF